MKVVYYIFFGLSSMILMLSVTFLYKLAHKQHASFDDIYSLFLMAFNNALFIYTTRKIFKS